MTAFITAYLAISLIAGLAWAVLKHPHRVWERAQHDGWSA